MRKKRRFGEFCHAFLHSAQPQTVTEIKEKLDIHQAIGQRIIQNLLHHKLATLYNDTKKPNNRKFYGPTPVGLVWLIVKSGEEFQQSGKEMKLKNVKLPISRYVKEYETLFKMWWEHGKFQEEVSKEIERERFRTKEDYVMAQKFYLEMWLRTQIEYEKVKDDMPQKYQFMIGKEILREKNPEFFNAMVGGSGIDEYDGWAGD